MITERMLKTLAVIIIACVVLVPIWHLAIFDAVLLFFSDRWREIVTAIAAVAGALMIACIWTRKNHKSRSPVCCADETDDCCKEKYKGLLNPYPPSEKQVSITGFKYQSDLHLLRLKQRVERNGTDREAQYIVGKDYKACYQLNHKSWYPITVPRGMLTDLASVPRLFRVLVGRVGPHLEASIIHDYLYVAWQVKDEKATCAKWRFADKLYLAAMQEAGMGCRAHLIYLAVRCCGWCIFKATKPEPLILCDKKLPACCVRAEEGTGGEDRSSGS